jgi:hypothetical protein
MSFRPSRAVAITIAVLAIFLLVGIAVLPEVARRIAVNRLQTRLTVPVQIADVDLNLFTGKLRIENLIIGPNRARPILNLPLASIDFSRLALLTGNIDLHAISLHNPGVVIERLDPATYNLMQALRPADSSRQTGAGGFSFAIQRLTVDGGDIVFVDHTQDPVYELTLSSLDFTAGPISTLPHAELTPTRFTAGVQVADGAIKFSGFTTLFGKTLETRVQAEISNVELARFSAYLPFGARLNLERTALNGEAQYVVSSQQGKVNKNFLDATLRIGQVILSPANGAQPIVRFSGASARNIHVDLLANSASIGTLALQDPYLKLRLDASGLNLQQFAAAAAPSGSDGHRNREAGQLALVIQEVTASDGAVEFIDQTISPQADITIRSVGLSANEVSVLPEFAAGAIKAGGLVGEGSVNVTGNIDNDPVRGQLVVTGEKLPYEPLRGYIDQIFDSAHSSGESVDGQITIAFEPGKHGGDLATTLSGNLAGHRMALRFADTQEPFLIADRLAVDLGTIRIDENVRFEIGGIGFTGAKLTVAREKDGSINLAQLWETPEQAEPAASQKQESGGQTTVAIRALTVDQSAAVIVDHSVSPNYRATVSNLSGNVGPLMPGRERAEIQFAGILGENAKLSVNGWLIPFSANSNMQLHATVQSYALPPLNPYATEYISHRIRQGEVTTEVDYTLKGDKLEATADIVLRDLRVGEKTGDAFAERVGIPLELALALLRDVGGAIRLQVSINSETGPQLNIANLIWRAVKNGILRAVTAPFRLVGNILSLGGRIGGVRIDPVLFEPGTRELRDSGEKQIAELGNLLKKKPALELRLTGVVSKAELEGLKNRKFWEKIQSAPGADYEKALVSVYRELGGKTRLQTPLTPEAEELLEKFVMNRLEISGEEVEQLASERAQLVERELQARGIDPQRLSATAAGRTAADRPAAVEVEIAS